MFNIDLPAKNTTPQSDFRQDRLCINTSILEVFWALFKPAATFDDRLNYGLLFSSTSSLILCKLFAPSAPFALGIHLA
jgi:hypothetical protein